MNSINTNIKGSVAKVNEYVIIRDLGYGSSAEVKLCQLIIPPDYSSTNQPRRGEQQNFANVRVADDGSSGGGGVDGREGRRRHRVSAETPVEPQRLWWEKKRGGENKEQQEERAVWGSFHDDLYVREQKSGVILHGWRRT